MALGWDSEINNEDMAIDRAEDERAREVLQNKIRLTLIRQAKDYFAERGHGGMMMHATPRGNYFLSVNNSGKLSRIRFEPKLKGRSAGPLIIDDPDGPLSPKEAAEVSELLADPERLQAGVRGLLARTQGIPFVHRKKKLVFLDRVDTIPIPADAPAGILAESDELPKCLLDGATMQLYPVRAIDGRRAWHCPKCYTTKYETAADDAFDHEAYERERRAEIGRHARFEAERRYAVEAFRRGAIRVGGYSIEGVLSPKAALRAELAEAGSRMLTTCTTCKGTGGEAAVCGTCRGSGSVAS